MKQAPFSRAKACEFRAWELDKTTRVQLWGPTPTRRGRSLPIFLYRFIYLELKENKIREEGLVNGEQEIVNGEEK